MSRFSESEVADYATQAAQPAAPAGLSQAATAAGGVVSGQSRFAESDVGRFVAEEGYVPAAQSWYTGASNESIANGWNTDFWDRMMAQNAEYGEKGILQTQFEEENVPTGVVTWDHDSADGTTHFTFGDVYDQGKKVGNLYEQFKDEPGTADLMMADILLPKEEKARVFEEAEVQEDGSVKNPALTDAIQAKRTQYNEEAKAWLTQSDFQQGVDQREEEMRDDGVAGLIDVGAALGGAAIGAGAGSAFFGIGALPGAIVGGLVGGLTGGVAAHMNQDALVEQAARASEITSLADRENGSAAGFASGVEQWAGFASKLISPLSNISQGATDWARGDVGDGTSEFYRTDAKGERVVPTWVKVTDVLGTVADMGLQFATPIGAGLYMTQMSATIGGEVGSLALTGGQSFDYSKGGFDNIFTDDDGDFSASQAAAGIGKVGIDVVQLGMARGLLGKVQASRETVGQAAVGAEGGSVWSRLYGKSPAPGTEMQAGFRFTRNAETGLMERTGKIPALSLLAPSEQLAAISARVLGMRTAAKQQHAYTADDFYNAAKALSAGERKWTTALVNGMGEGYEEAMQAVLEPYSHQNSINMHDIGNAAVYGFAGGVGMGLGTGSRMPSMADRQFAMAQIAHRMQTGTDLTRSEWNALSQTEQRAKSSLGALEQATAKAAFDTMNEEHAIERVAGVEGINRYDDAVQSHLKSELAKGTDRTDKPFVIVQLQDAGRVDAQGNILPSSMPSDAVASSGEQLSRNFTNRMRGFEIQRGALTTALADAKAAAAAAPADADLQAAVATAQKRLDRLNLTLHWAQRIDPEVDDRISRMYGPSSTLASMDAEAISFNVWFRAAYNMEIDTYEGVALTEEDKRALSRAVSQVVTRDPQDQSGSYPVLVPQISAKLTAAKTNDVLEVSHAILPAIRGDYDGDKVRTQEQLMLDDNEFANARAGMFYLGAGVSVNVKAPKYEAYVIDNMGRAMRGDNKSLSAYATGMLSQVATAIRARYTNLPDGKGGRYDVVPDQVIDKVWKAFYDAVRSGSKDARKVLIDGLAKESGGTLTTFARGNLSNEWLWLDQLVRATTQDFQEAYAARNPTGGPVPDTSIAIPTKQSKRVREIRIAKAADQGVQLALETAGDSMFRKFQKLHYSSLAAAVKGAVSKRRERMSLYDQAELYRMLSSLVSQSQMDEIRGKDDITTRVAAQIKYLAREAKRLNPRLDDVQAMVVVANMQVTDIDINPVTGEIYSKNKPISLTQMLLKRSVAQDRADKDAIYDLSPELQAKHARLLAMTKPPTQGVKGSKPVNAEMAFVEVFGSQQLYTLLGDSAMVFGPHLTVEQYVRMYASRSPGQRRGTDRQLKGEPEYLTDDRKSRNNPPYSLDEVRNGEVSAYRAVVDAIIAVGHNRITIDKDGVLNGEYADRSVRVSKAFKEAHGATRAALKEFLALAPRREGEVTLDVIQRMLSSSSEFSRAVMAAIPTDAVPAVLLAENNEVYMANWVYAMFATKKAEHAEMIFWRSVMLAQWNALGMETWMQEEGAEDGIAARKYSDLQRRFHRVLYDLHPTRAKDGGVQLSRLTTRMMESTSLEDFIHWVNTEPGILPAEQAPIVAWVDDTSEFDPDKAQGGWTTSMQGAELRESITDLKRVATNLAKDLAAEKSAQDADNAILDAIESVIAYDAGDTSVTLAQGARRMYNQFAKAIEQAGDLALGLGPQAILYQVVGAVRGFYPQAHTKGKNPDYVEVAGAIEAMRDAFDYTTNFERMLASLTTLNLTAVGGNAGQAAKDDLRTMDDDGKVINQAKPTVESMALMLRDPDTRALARSILFPQVMERDFDGAMRPKMLVGKNLKSLLEGTTMDNLFPKDDKLSMDSALTYLSALEAEARNHGGRSHEVQRMLNEYVVARTAGATRSLSTYDIEQLTIEAAHHVARILQASGAVASKAEATPGAADPLKPLMDAAVTVQRGKHTARRLGFFGKGRTPLEEADLELLSETALFQMIEARDQEFEQDIQAVLDQALAHDPSDRVVQDALEKQRQALLVDQATFKERATILQSDDIVRDTVAMFTQDNSAVTNYVMKNLDMLQRSSASLLTLNKLVTQINDKAYAGQPDLTPEEWTELSNAVIAVYIDRVASTTAAYVSVPPFPDADHAEDQRFYDHTFSYLLKPMMDVASPLVKAAKSIHNKAGRQGEDVADTEFIKLLENTFYKDFTYGSWTSDIPRASIEANQRLDSSSAAPAIAMAGNSPKRQAVFSAATRRTFAVPPDTLLSTALLSFKDLGKSGFDTIDVGKPGGVADSMPVMALNNRFAKGVKLFYTDEMGVTQQADLLVEDKDLGRPFIGDEAANGSGLYEIHMDRIRLAVERAMLKRNLDPLSAGVSVGLEFFHPDSQPAFVQDEDGKEIVTAPAADGKPPKTWMHNLYFEGTSFSLDADRFESLNASLWFAEGGINPVAQANALDASKLGLPALQVIPTPSAADRAFTEQNWRTDFIGMLRLKTQTIMSTDLGFGRLDPEYYNAVFKNAKMRHFVSGTVDGNRVLWTAEQVIEAQQTGQALPDEAELWVPSDDVLRQMLGESAGIPAPGRRNRILSTNLEIDLAKVPTFTSINGQMMEWYKNGIAGMTTTIDKTRIATRARQQQLVVRASLDKKSREAYDARMLYFSSLEEAANKARALLKTRGGDAYNFQGQLARVVQETEAMLRAENIPFDWAGTAGIPFIGPRKPGDVELSKMLLRDLEAALVPHGNRTGWIYQEGAKADAPHGILSNVSLKGEKNAALRIAPGDLVAVDLDYFGDNSDLARKRLAYMVERGATIVLTGSNGSTDMRAEMGVYLQSLQHGRIAGSVHMYAPNDLTDRYANQRARSSTMLAVREITAKNMVAILNLPDKAVAENSAWVNVKFDEDGNLIPNERLSSIAVTMDLVPSGFLGGFNVPVESMSNNTRDISQIEMVRQQLFGKDTKAGRKLLFGLGLKDQHKMTAEQVTEAEVNFNWAYDRLIQRLKDNPGTVLPQPKASFGTGDIIPLVGPSGEILLYRHGHQAPRNLDEVLADAAMSMPSDGQDAKAANMAVFSTALEPAASTHIGTVASVQPRSGFGLSIELNIDLSLFGDKKVLEWNGMKFLLTPMSDEIVLPDHGIFPNWVIDLIASSHDMVSKESTEGVVNNHRDAFAYLGIDFMPDLMKFFGENERDTRQLLELIASRAPRISTETAYELMHANRIAGAFIEQLTQFSGESTDAAGVNWADLFSDMSDVESQIASAVIVYLCTPGAQVDAVLASTGFGDDTVGDETRSLLMPSLFTEVFDNAPIGSALRSNINARLNNKLNNPDDGSGVGYHLDQTWNFTVTNADPRKNLTGFLQFAEAHSSGDNPLKNGMSFDESERGAVSAHSAWIAYQATGADTAYKYDIAKARIFAEGKGLTRFGKDAADGGAWRMLTGIDPESKKLGHVWRTQTPGEHLYRDMGEDAVVQFRQKVPKKNDKYWSADERRQAENIAVQIVEHLKMDKSQAGIVDYWVRQVLGMPAGTDAAGNDVGRISGKGFLEAADDIRWNVLHGYMPTIGAEVPLLHLHDLQAIYRANRGLTNGWKPRDSMDATANDVSAWHEWVNVSLGSALTADNLFDPLYLLSLDGFMHTYQNATNRMLDLPVSLDRIKSVSLMDPATSRMIVSLEADMDLLTSTPLMIDTARATLDSLIGGVRIAGRYQSKVSPASEIARRREVRRKWRKENGVPVPVDVSVKNMYKNGIDFVDKGTTANALVRFMINMRVGMALFNPALYVSMGPEQWIRGSIDRSANILTGQSTAGLTGRLMARAGVSRYTPAELVSLSRLTDTLGKRNEFKRMVYTDLWYLRPHEMGGGKIGHGAENFAKFTSRMQDPTHGMSAKTLGRRYMDGALQHILATPTMNTLTPETLFAQMRTNPEYLQNNFPDAHQAGVNAIAQLRSLKATPLSLMLRGIYEPMSESSNSATNFLGNVVLKMPLLFSGYAMNVLTTITGMQGISDMVAMAAEGRKKGYNSFFGRIQAKLAGREFSPEEDANFDMSSVIEGIDLTRSFIRGGVTHSGLFMFGLMAGGLGLSGEDDETKKRRRLAELQGAGFIYDPRAIENDFRNKDAIFLDWLPFGLDTYFKVTPGPDGRSMAQMHWLLKQFVSPIMGFERFYETGDFRNVTWGFQDALGSFPLINTQMWDDAVETAHEFASMADDEAKVGGPTNMVAASGFLANAVGVYERMLFENSFVNMLYTSFDKYDRNPYALPQRDSDGTIQRDIEDQPYAQDLALKSFIDPETGKLVRGYEKRDQASGMLHALTENRATMAFAMSLFSGLGDSDYLRRNMVVKTQSLQKPVVTKAEAEAIIRRTAQLAGGLANLTAAEIRSGLIQRNIAAGVFQQPEELDAEAAAIAEKAGVAPMSMIDQTGAEILTKEGARGVFQGLYKGSVSLADASLQGVYIDYDMRTEITNEWTKELVQEGVDMGLDQTKATSRMKRIMYGEYGTDQVGLAELLWMKPEDGGLSFSKDVNYNQLNTTYVMGPDGRPWATGFTRDGVMGALGLKPFKRAYVSQQLGVTGNDERLNTTDLINGMNTGLRGLELIDETRYIPTDVEIGKAIEQAIKDAAAAAYTPFTPYNSGSGGSGYTPYKRRKYGYSRRSYPDFGGGGGFYFNRMYTLPRGVTPYGNSIPFINTSNPQVRRADIRRERVWSERGRLKQWQ